MMSESKEASESKKPTPNPTATKRERLQVDPEEFVLRKRLPSRFPSRPNDVYVNNRTNFKAQLARCFRCLETDDIVFIHGLGAAVTKAINLALQLQQKASVPLGISVNTSTVKLIGNLSCKKLM